MKKRYFFPVMAALSLGMAASVASCSDDKDDKKDNGSEAASKPEAFMFFNEFVPDGGTLKVKGQGFDANTVVEFQGADGAALAGEVTVKSADEVWVKVPAGVAESSFVTFKNAKTGESTECGIRLRDTRNVLVDFDTEESINNTYGAGANGKGEDGSYVMTAPDASIPENYSKNGKNQYGWFTNDGWQAISFLPGMADAPTTNNVFGSLLDDAKVNIEKYVVKFEMCVPTSGALDGLGLTVGFTSPDDDGLGNCRNFAAFFQPAEIVWNKEDTVNGWTVEKINKYTQTEWMTVTIPMSEFVWNAGAMNYYTSASNLVEGYPLEGEVAEKIYAAEGKSYAQVNGAAIADSRKLKSLWGGLILCTNTFDYGQGGEEKYSGILAIDNVRIVPNDGNGAIYGKVGFGVPSQHFVSAPRTVAFK